MRMMKTMKMIEKFCKKKAKRLSKRWQNIMVNNPLKGCKPITFNRYISFVAAAMMMLCGGMTYVFATLSLPLKLHMNYEQYQINIIGTMSSAGNIMGILPALFHDYLGPRPTAFLASVLMSSGYALIYMACAGWFPSQYWLIGCFYLIFSAGESACFTSAMATSIKNFNPKHRGKVSGMMSCIYGLASAIFSGIFKYVFHQDLMGFLIFLTLFAGIVPLVSGIFLNVVPKDFDRKRKLQEELEHHEKMLNRGDEAVVVVSASINDQEEQQLEQESEEMILLKTKTKHITTTPPPDVDISLAPWNMVRTVDFYLFCLSIFAGMGVGQSITNNLGSAVVSYGGTKDAVPTMLIINSIASCIGRIVMGYLSDRLSPFAIRPSFLNICVFLMGCVSFLFAFANVSFIYFLVFCYGFAYGGINAVIVAYLADRFGPKYLGMNNTICKLSALLGNYLMATVLASTIYQSHIKGSGKTCHGRDCYQVTFLIMSGICLLAYVSTLLLMHRNQAIYAEIRKKSLIGKK